MKTALFYYTGTGNSLWSARILADALGQTELWPMARMQNDEVQTGADSVGLVFPVHMWGVPEPVIRFVQRLQSDPAKYYFALAVNAGQVSATLLQLRRLLSHRHIQLSSGFSLVLPSNYIPWGGPGPETEMNRRFSRVESKIKELIAPVIQKQMIQAVEQGPLWQKVLLTALYKMTFARIPTMDHHFWVDEKCNACSICARLCPAANIRLESGRPVWQHHCEQCLACIQWCPQQAIQYGKKTPAYPRYHHPAIQLKDLLQSALRE
jgi:Pyruvate/2-oxoacid:ferredoxin oxidoreductase delta subunit